MKRIAVEDLRVKKEIGKGSFGRVLLAEYEGRSVVVKELLPDVGCSLDEKATFQTFQNEVVIMSCLRHEKIIQLVGVSLHPSPSFVLELAVFGDLAHAIVKLSKTSFPWRDRLKASVQFGFVGWLTRIFFL